MIPIKNAPRGETTSQLAVIATRPASAPLRHMDTSGFLYLIQVMIRQAVAATAGAMLVVTKTVAIVVV